LIEMDVFAGGGDLAGRWRRGLNRALRREPRVPAAPLEFRDVLQSIYRAGPTRACCFVAQCLAEAQALGRSTDRPGFGSPSGRRIVRVVRRLRHGAGAPKRPQY